MQNKQNKNSFKLTYRFFVQVLPIEEKLEHVCQFQTQMSLQFDYKINTTFKYSVQVKVLPIVKKYISSRNKIDAR